MEDDENGARGRSRPPAFSDQAPSGVRSASARTNNAGQEYQAFLYKYHVEFYRRHKFARCNGCLFFHFKDCWPAITASVVDYYGVKKKAYHTLRHAFTPLHVLMEWPDLEGETAGTTLRKRVHVVNDLHRPHDSLTVQWQVSDAAGSVHAADRIACRVAENGIAAVGEVLADPRGRRRAIPDPAPPRRRRPARLRQRVLGQGTPRGERRRLIGGGAPGARLPAAARAADDGHRAGDLGDSVRDHPAAPGDYLSTVIANLRRAGCR